MKKSKISIDKINNAIKKIVEQIEVSEFKPEMIVSINRGGCIPGVYLSHYFKKPHNIIDIKAITYKATLKFRLNISANKLINIIKGLFCSSNTPFVFPIRK